MRVDDNIVDYNKFKRLYDPLTRFISVDLPAKA